MKILKTYFLQISILGLFILNVFGASAQTQKPIIYGKNWVAITGKPLAATSGAKIFERGGNAVDAACAMLASTCTMWDVLSWGGETQALIYNPHTKKVIAINALGVAPTGATASFFKDLGLRYPPQYGPLAAVTPGTPGGLLVMLAEYGTLSLAEVLGPALELARGYPIEAQTANSMEKFRDTIALWPSSRKVFLPHQGEKRQAPHAGEIFIQNDLFLTLSKLVDAERKALNAGLSRKQAIYKAYERFYTGDIAEDFVRGVHEAGGLITLDDLKNWQVYIEEPVKTMYKDIEVYKLDSWTQSPVLLQSLNMLEQLDMSNMSYNSDKYIHALYQVMNLAFADRDFYYGDPYFAPQEPMQGLMSKEYAKQRVKEINWDRNDKQAAPGDPYLFQDGDNPYLEYLKNWNKDISAAETWKDNGLEFPDNSDIYSGTTTIQAADKEGWIVSMTPSGGWIPAVIAGNTGIGLSQRMQSFVVEPSENPYNVVEPGKRPRVTLTPSLAFKDGKPYLSFAVQGGDSQDQNLLQFFLNVVEFGMNVQEACEAANMNSFQMHGSFGQHGKQIGKILLHSDTPPWTLKKLKSMGYDIELRDRTSGPINAIYFDHEHGTMWGGSSNYGEDYGIGW